MEDIHNDEIRAQYRVFIDRLSQVVTTDDKDSKHIIKQFLSTKEELFHRIEIIVHVITVAAIKVSTESVLESNVSVFERHFHKGRPMKEETMEREMQVAMNGTNLVESDGLLKHSVDRYWRGKRWHFIKKKDIRDYNEHSESLVLKRLKAEKSKLPFAKI